MRASRGSPTPINVLRGLRVYENARELKVHGFRGPEGGGEAACRWVKTFIIIEFSV